MPFIVVMDVVLLGVFRRDILSLTPTIVSKAVATISCTVLKKKKILKNQNVGFEVEVIIQEVP